MSPAGSAAAFYRALLRVPGWSVMTVTAAAHEVQGNQDPGFYTPYESTGRALFASLAGPAAPVVRSATLTTPACTAVTADDAGLAGTGLGARAARARIAVARRPLRVGRAGYGQRDGLFRHGRHGLPGGWVGPPRPHHPYRRRHVPLGDVLPITGLSPGDLVFSEISDGRAGHVGLSIGGGQVVEEPHPGDHEKIVSLTTYGWQAAGRLHV